MILPLSINSLSLLLDYTCLEDDVDLVDCMGEDLSGAFSKRFFLGLVLSLLPTGVDVAPGFS